MFFSLITKNSIWEILTKNLRMLLLLKDKMGFRMKTFNIFGVNWKIRFLGVFYKKPIQRGKLPNTWGHGQFSDFGGGGGGVGKKEGVLFLKGLIP